MSPQAKRLLAARSQASKEICARIHTIVTIDAQLDTLALDDSDTTAVREMKETQDTCIVDAIVSAAQVPA